MPTNLSPDELPILTGADVTPIVSRDDRYGRAAFTFEVVYEAIDAADAAAADAAQTALDRAQTEADAAQTALDRAQTEADAAQTEADATATAADRVQTGIDAADADASATALVGVIDAQRIGLTGTPATGTATLSNTFVFETPTTGRGQIAGFTAFALSDCTVYIRRWTRAGDVFTRSASDYEVSLVTGLNDLTFDGPLVEEGEYLGFFAGTALARLNVTADAGAGYYAEPGNLVAFTEASVTTTVSLQAAFTLSLGQIAYADKLARDTADTLAEIVVEDQIIGYAATPVTGFATANNTYVFETPVSSDGRIKGFSCFAMTDGTAFLRRFIKSGDTFTQIGNDLTINVVAGVNDLVIDGTNVEAGEYLGVYAARSLAYITADASLGAGYYVGTGNVTSFTDADVTTTASLQWAVTLNGGPVAVLQGQIAALEAGTLAPGYDDRITSADIIAGGVEIEASLILRREDADVPVADTFVLTTPTATYARYDMLYLDTLTLELGIQAGTERVDDPTVGIPVLTASERRPVALLRVFDGAIVVVPVWDVYDGEVFPDQMEKERRRNRTLLPKTRSLIGRRQAFHIVGFGDSITCIRGGPGDMPTATPNGVGRDRGATAGTGPYLRGENYGDDIVNALPLYTAVQLGRAADAAGTDHTKVGWNWEFVTALEGLGYVLGTDLTYDNFGIGGYATSDAVSAGVPTSWLTNAAALGGDLAIVCLGMNELGDSATEANMRVIIQTFQAAGTEVLVIGCPRRRLDTFTANWKITCRALKRAAEIEGAAFIATTALFADNAMGAAGFAVNDLGQANGGNHPGLIDFRVIGREITKLMVNT